jgi:LuxR family maltose regulon positive regulatory protein
VQSILHAANTTGSTGSPPQLSLPPAPVSALLAEPLSAQELRVLRLLAAGRSNPEIANELIVSVNTIKAHVQNIFRKLNVNKRVEAVEAARMLQLL